MRIEPGSSKHLIVYVDDDHDDLSILRSAFANFIDRIDLVTMDNPFEALRYLKGLRGSGSLPCLIILDVNMPGMNGKELLEEIRKLDGYGETPVVLFSTSSFSRDLMFAAKFNAVFKPKPLSYAQIEGIAEEFIGHCCGSSTLSPRQLA